MALTGPPSALAVTPPASPGTRTAPGPGARGAPATPLFCGFWGLRSAAPELHLNGLLGCYLPARSWEYGKRPAALAHLL